MALTGLQFLIVVLAAYRAARLLTKDDLFETPRARIGDWSMEKWNEGHAALGKIETLVSCPYCMGWWLSIVAYVTACVALDRWAGVGLWVHAVECWGVMGGQALLNALDAWFEQTNKAATEISDD